jgi:hypothetical protein
LARSLADYPFEGPRLLAGWTFDFTGVVFDGGDFRFAQFSGGWVSFNGARFSGGTVDFSRAPVLGRRGGLQPYWQLVIPARISLDG